MTRPIWEYRAQTTFAPLLRDVFTRSTCPCCVAVQLLAPSDAASQSDGRRYTEHLEVLTCQSCGWWFACRNVYDSSCGSNPDSAVHVVDAAGAALETYAELLDRATLLLLRDEVEQHIKGRGSSSAWAAFEDATGAILKSFGYRTRVTNRAKDGGIDAILDHPSAGTVFVQVKHSKNKVNVRVLRELVGTMVLHGSKTGLLVTSSTFTEDTHVLKRAYDPRGLAIELVDGERFLSALKLSTRLEPPTFAEVLRIAGSLTSLIYEEVQV